MVEPPDFTGGVEAGWNKGEKLTLESSVRARASMVRVGDTHVYMIVMKVGEIGHDIITRPHLKRAREVELTPAGFDTVGGFDNATGNFEWGVFVRGCWTGLWT